MIRRHPIRNVTFGLGPFFFVALCGIAKARQPQALSLPEALNLACENNPKMAQCRERRIQKKWENRAAAGNFLPTVSVTAGYTAMNKPLTMDLDQVRDAMLSLQTSTLTKMAVDSLLRANNNAVPPALVNAFERQYSEGTRSALDAAVPHFIDTLKDQYYPNANITVTQPVFAGGKIIGAKSAARADLRTADAETDRARAEVIGETFTNYFAVALLKNVVAVRKDVLEGMLKHVKDATALTETGMIPKSNLLRAGVAAAEARRNLADDENRLYLARLSLAKSLGLSDSASVDVVDSLSRRTLCGTEQSFLARADEHQPVLRLVGTRVEAARAKVMVERSALLPRIGVWGKAELLPDYLSALEPQYAAGVTATMDINAGGGAVSRLEAASHLVRETELLLQGTRRDVHLWVRKAFVDCKNAEDRYAKLAADQDLAGENLRVCRSRFESGYGTATEVVDAELALEKNRVDMITSLFDFYRSYMDLCNAAGDPDRAAAVTSAVKGELQ
jgi:outer membrane protein